MTKAIAGESVYSPNEDQPIAYWKVDCNLDRDYFEFSVQTDSYTTALGGRKMKGPASAKWYRLERKQINRGVAIWRATEPLKAEDLPKDRFSPIIYPERQADFGTDEPRVETMGDYLVARSFNPSGIDDVDEIKAAAAGLIDKIRDIPENHVKDDDQLQQIRRMKALAVTKIQEGSMWAVGAATKPPRGA